MATLMKLVIKFVEFCMMISTFENDILPGLEENEADWEKIIEKVKSWFE